GVGVAQDGEVPGVPGAWVDDRQRPVLAEPSRLIVRRGRPTAGGPLVEVGEQDAQYCRLQLIQARVVARLLEGGLVAGAVKAKDPRALGNALVVGRDRAAIAETWQVLGGEEGEGRDRAKRPRVATMRDGAGGLRGVLDHGQAGPFVYLRDWGRI